MGVVYRGYDPDLERPVAVKLLDPDFASDPESMSRFRREAQVLAALNHPRIAIIYSLQVVPSGAQALILEWIEGENLADRLERERLPLTDVLRIGADVAAALAAAHEVGVVHRDLKPSNVMIDRQGRIKVLDFGIAKRDPLIWARDHRSPVQDATLTAPGMILGTPRYMSPEQLLGQSVDRRADVFGFGCLLFECLAGKKPFDGRNMTEIIAVVMSSEPDWKALSDAVPPSVTDLLRSCLKKDPADRLADIAEARSLLEEILSHPRPAASTVPEAAPLRREADRPRPELPVPLSRFIGREEALRECARLLEQERLLTIIGPGGCGKTRLALKLAEDVTQSSRGLCFVDLSTATNTPRVHHMLASSLGVQELTDDIPAAAAGRIGDQSFLMILDNCEQVLEACADLAGTLLERCPRLQVLATSRQALGIAGENRYRVPPMSVPGEGSVSDLALVAEAEAVRLFVDRAAQSEHGFAITERNAAAVADICRHLDGIPLAIELAAARVRMLDVDQIRSRLDDRFRLLRSRDPLAATRQQTLEATIQWSHDLLTPEERRVFRNLSVFSGSFSLEAAASVGEAGSDEYAVLDLLEQLADKSLLQVEASVGGVRRYRLLETIRQFAHERLTEQGEEAALRERHLGFFLALAERAEPKLWGSEQKSFLDGLDHEHDNLLAALSWCAQSGSGGEAGLRLAASLRRFWFLRGNYALGRSCIERALATAPTKGRATAARAQALDGAGNFALVMGDYAAARARFAATLETQTAIGDLQGMARANTGLGHVHLQQSEFEAAAQAYGEALAICRKLGDRQGVAAALGNLGGVALMQDDLERADGLMAEAAIEFRAIGNDHHLALALAMSGLLATRRGAIEIGRTRLAECLPFVSRLNAKRLLVVALEAVAEHAAVTGRWAPAVRLFAASERTREEIGAPLGPREKQVQDRVIAGLRGEADDSGGFERTWAEGCSLPLEAVLEEATRCVT